MIAAAGCPLPLAPLCDAVGGAGSSIAGGVLSSIVDWVVAGADWLLQQIGNALSASTAVHLGAPWFESHYQVMVALAAVVAVPMLAVAAIQAVVRQSPATLVRVALVQVPLAGLMSAVAVQLVQLSLGVTDELSSAVSSSSGADISRSLAGVASLLVTQAAVGSPVPTFVLALGALLVVAGALVLWLELIVRAAAVYVAVLFLPLALAGLLWPALSHWCRRLVETLAAAVLSKFVIVAVLSLAVGAVASGAGFASVLAGGALLLLAAFTPFSLLRLVPMIEAGAVLHLEGARHRVRQAFGTAPTSAASFALGQLRERASAPGVPGTGTAAEPEAAGGTGPTFPTEVDAPAGTGGGEGPATAGDSRALRGSPPGPQWRGDPSSVEAFERALRAPRPGGGRPVQPDFDAPPLWGGNLPGHRLGAPDPSSPGHAGPRGRFEVGRDALGPILRWVPGPRVTSGDDTPDSRPFPESED